MADLSTVIAAAIACQAAIMPGVCAAEYSRVQVGPPLFGGELRLYADWIWEITVMQAGEFTSEAPACDGDWREIAVPLRGRYGRVLWVVVEPQADPATIQITVGDDVLATVSTGQKRAWECAREALTS